LKLNSYVFGSPIIPWAGFGEVRENHTQQDEAVQLIKCYGWMILSSSSLLLHNEEGKTVFLELIEYRVATTCHNGKLHRYLHTNLGKSTWLQAWQLPPLCSPAKTSLLPLCSFLLLFCSLLLSPASLLLTSALPCSLPASCMFVVCSRFSLTPFSS
jgi:hypothetical protein